MAPTSSCCIFFLFQLLINCSSGNATASPKVELWVLPTDRRVDSSAATSGSLVYLFLNERQVRSLISSEPATVSWLKAHVLHEKQIRSRTVAVGQDNSGTMELQNLQLALKNVGRIIISHGVKMSVAFPLPFLEILTEGNARDLFKGIEKSASSVIIEANISDDWHNGDWLLAPIVERAAVVSSHLPKNGLSAVLAIKGPAAPTKISQLRRKILEISKNKKTEIEIIYVKESTSAPSRRELLNSNNLKSTGHDTVFPMTPIPTVVTVPGTAGSATITPTNPTMTPAVFPPPNSATYPAPSVTNPVTPIPVTNPVTTYPSSPGTPTITPTPGTVPSANPPATPGASPAVAGQSWCIVKAGATETALQAALDYACGIGGADCSQIQMGASCYNPNSLQNHASYAFNSYYQRNPVATSCDFGGTATIVATNPSVGSCIYPTYSQTPAPATTTTTTPTPTPTDSLSPPSTGAVPVPVPGTGTPPAVLNTGTPASGNPTSFGLTGPPPPAMTTPISSSAGLQSYVGCTVLLIILVLQIIH